MPLRSAPSVNPCPAALVLAAKNAAPRFPSGTPAGLWGLTAPLSTAKRRYRKHVVFMPLIGPNGQSGVSVGRSLRVGGPSTPPCLSSSGTSGWRGIAHSNGGCGNGGPTFRRIGTRSRAICPTPRKSKISVCGTRSCLPNSLDLAVCPNRLSICSDHSHLFTRKTGVFDRHAKKQVFVFLVLGGKCILM